MPVEKIRVTATLRFYKPHQCSLVFSCSIGGDSVLERVTTLPSEFMLLVWQKLIYLSHYILQK